MAPAITHGLAMKQLTKNLGSTEQALKDKVSAMDEFEDLTEEDLLMIEGALEFADEALELAELALPAYWEVLNSDIS